MIADTSITPTDLHTTLDLTGKTVTVATAAGSTNTTAAASTAFVHAHIDAVLDSAPGTLNTLNDIAAVLNDDANFNTTVTNAIAAKLPLAGVTLTGHLNISDYIRLKFVTGSDIPSYHVNSNACNYI